MVYGGQRKHRRSSRRSRRPRRRARCSAGGVIDAGARLRRRRPALDRADAAGRPRPSTLVAGLAYDDAARAAPRLRELHRPGATPVLGVQGALAPQRDATRSQPRPVRAGHAGSFAERWTLRSRRAPQQRALRVARTTTSSAPNRDDSGSARYSATLPVAGADATQATPRPARSTPRPAAASRRRRSTSSPTAPTAAAASTSRCSLRRTTASRSAPRRALAGGLLTAALFETRTDDEIVTATNVGGRATFQNAGAHAARRLRAGVAARDARDHWRTQLAYTWLDARYRDAF